MNLVAFGQQRRALTDSSRRPRKQTYPMSERPLVLVVDDDPHIRDFIAELLRGELFIVDTASDGVEGLAALQRRHPAVILLDMMMPCMDGPTFLQALRASEQDCTATPVILMSAAPGLAEWAATFHADYLPKPFPSLESVVEKVRDQLRPHALHRTA